MAAYRPGVQRQGRRMGWGMDSLPERHNLWHAQLGSLLKADVVVNVHQLGGVLTDDSG